MSDINKTHDSSMLARIWTRDLSSISGGSENLFNQYENQYDGSSGSWSTSNEVNSKGDSSYHRDTCRTTYQLLLYPQQPETGENLEVYQQKNR